MMVMRGYDESFIIYFLAFFIFPAESIIISSVAVAVRPCWLNQGSGKDKDMLFMLENGRCFAFGESTSLLLS